MLKKFPKLMTKERERGGKKNQKKITSILSEKEVKKTNSGGRLTMSNAHKAEQAEKVYEQAVTHQSLSPTCRLLAGKTHAQSHFCL